jgi:phosphatidylglycerophosphate synthase
MLEIHNFVLDISNNIGVCMKKSYLFLAIPVIVILGVLVGFVYANQGNSSSVQYYIIILLVTFALFLGFRRFKAEKKGQPAEDEFSKKLTRKASSISFYISLYLLLALNYLSDKMKLEAHTALSYAIIGMASIFAVSWGLIYLIGMKDE